KPSTVYLPKLFIIPLILLALQCETFFSQDVTALVLVIVLGTVLSFFIHSRYKVEIITQSKSVKLPGSYLNLFVLLSIFSVKYFFGYTNATESDLANTYALLEMIMNGLFFGYFLGQAICYTGQYLKQQS